MTRSAAIRRLQDRRRFLKTSAAGSLAVGFGVWSSRSLAESKSPHEKLNIACVGTANQARFSIGGLASQNLVAFTDVDERSLGQAAQDFPAAKMYHDFRKMLEQSDIDAVMVATPDHIHAPATLAAIKLGKHVYCEKPLTHTVHEARQVAKAAAEMKVATQMGTQIHAEPNYRRVVEILQSGVIGKVKEVHTWAGRAWSAVGRPTETPAVPDYLHWDLYLGPAAERPYSPAYHPSNWRKYWAFGGGNLADMACHHMDLPFWALKLRHPRSIAAEGPPVDPEGCPSGLKVTYQYAADGEQPATTLTWYDGDRIPAKILDIPTEGGGNIFVGEKGLLRADYGSWKLYPESDFVGYQPPAPTIPNSIGHHNEWIAACKGGAPALCNFGYAGPLTEAVLLGDVAYRSGKPLAWDAAAFRITNHPDAEKWLSKEYRRGWELPS